MGCRGAASRDGLVIRVEAETRLRDVQATLRKVHGKSTADPGRVLFAVRDSRSNRAAAAAAADILAVARSPRARDGPRRCSAQGRTRAPT